MKQIAILISILITGCTSGNLPVNNNEDRNDGLPAISLDQIAEDVWIHKSYEDIPPYGPVLSQGLIVVKNGQSLIIDSAWNDADTRNVLTLSKEITGATTSIAILTHAHNDKMGGVKAFRDQNIDTVALDLTNEDAIKRGLQPAKRSLNSPFKSGRIFTNTTRNITDLIDGPEVEVFYPGPGHTRDNIVVYVPSAKVLFGGCLIRPGHSKTLGNVADADVDHWAKAIQAVAERFPDAEIIVPSHGAAGDRALLDHTIALAKAHAGE